MRIPILALTALLAVAAPARAVTMDDIVALAKAGVGAEVLVALIDADDSVFGLTTDDVVALKQAGVPDAVVVRMLRAAKRVPAADTSRAAKVPTVPAVVAFPYPVFVGVPVFPGVPLVNVPRLTYDVPRGFGRFINDGFVQGRGFGRFINEPAPR